MASILIVEDETHIADVVEFLLRDKGWETRRAEDGETGLRVFREQNPDLVLLDLQLPGIGGLELFRMIRGARPGQAVIMLTSRGEEDDRVQGLELGADDYIPKPFNNRELVARVGAVLRRLAPNASPEPECLARGPLRLWPGEFRFEVAGKRMDLPRHEFLLMEALLRRPLRVYPRDTLIGIMYPDDAEVFDNAVDTAVYRLRRKLREVSPDLAVVETVYGLGYRLSEALS